MLESVLHTYARNLDYANRLVADVPPEGMAVQPAPGMNHAAWVIGHLTFVCDLIGGVFGLAPAMPAAWLAIFNNESHPSADAAIYPEKAALVAALARGHARVAEAVAHAGPGAMVHPLPDEKFRQFFPTIGDAVTYLCTSHESVHLGQLSAWRRVQGMPSV